MGWSHGDVVRRSVSIGLLCDLSGVGVLFLSVCDSLLLLPFDGSITAWLLDFLLTFLLDGTANEAAHMLGNAFEYIAEDFVTLFREDFRH